MPRRLDGCRGGPERGETVADPGSDTGPATDRFLDQTNSQTVRPRTGQGKQRDSLQNDQSKSRLKISDLT